MLVCHSSLAFFGSRSAREYIFLRERRRWRSLTPRPPRTPVGSINPSSRHAALMAIGQVSQIAFAILCSPTVSPKKLAWMLGVFQASLQAACSLHQSISVIGGSGHLTILPCCFALTAQVSCKFQALDLPTVVVNNQGAGIAVWVVHFCNVIFVEKEPVADFALCFCELPCCAAHAALARNAASRARAVRAPTPSSVDWRALSRVAASRFHSKNSVVA